MKYVPFLDQNTLLYKLFRYSELTLWKQLTRNPNLSIIYDILRET